MARPAYHRHLPTRHDAFARSRASATVGCALPGWAMVGWALVMLGFAGGCRSNAYSDVYNQKLASEVRVLEDQLYEADYQNRVLQEKLQRSSIRAEKEYLQPSRSRGEGKVPARSSAPPAEQPKTRSPKPLPDPQVDSYSPDDFDLGDDFGAGELIEPGTPEPLVQPEDSSDLESKSAPPSESNSPLPPAPGGPVPPGPSDLKIPELIPGEMLPPPSSSGLPEKPPGQIQLPDAVRALSPGGAKVGTPISMSIHPGLSAGHTFDDGSEGLYLIVNVLDDQNRPLDLESFEIQAPLTIVATDPNRELKASRVDRWEFKAEEVVKMIRNEPVSGLAIPLHWNGDRPDCDAVLVHVRLKSDGEEMRCEAKLNLKPRSTVAEWTPRSPAKKH